MIDKIINDLCNHKISKEEAISKIRDIIKGLRYPNSIECQVKSVGFTVHKDDGILKLRVPYQYSKIKGLISEGDLIDLIIRP